MPQIVTPGFRFKDGKLYIFQPTIVRLIHGWPRLEAVCKRDGEDGWKPFEPGFRLVAPYRPRKAKESASPQMELNLGAVPVALTQRERRTRAFDGFRFAMPKAVAARVEPFQSLQWRLLQLFQVEPRALEVCRSNPALVFCLANGGSLGESREIHRVEGAAKAVLRKQRELMPLFGWPDTGSAVKATARILPESISYESMQQWRSLLADRHAAKMLAHLQRINAGVIAILSEPRLRRSTSPTLLDEVAGSPQEKYRGVVAARVTENLFMQERLDGPDQRRVYTSKDQVMAHHSELSRDSAKLKLVAAFKSRFPSPPLPGTPEIRPVRSPQELAAEGREQSNCVASYCDRILAKRVYVYRVLSPERATLSIVPGTDGDWRIDELQLSHNRGVSRETRQQVETWIEQFMISA